MKYFELVGVKTADSHLRRHDCFPKGALYTVRKNVVWVWMIWDDFPERRMFEWARTRLR